MRLYTVDLSCDVGTAEECKKYFQWESLAGGIRIIACRWIVLNMLLHPRLDYPWTQAIIGNFGGEHDVCLMQDALKSTAYTIIRQGETLEVTK